MKICIIGVYFGKFPDYMPLWIKSASFNKKIDFKIFTDQIIDNLPDNIQLIDFNINKLKILISSKMGFNVVLEKPYKCCDYKPAYGLIFDDYLIGYDYWGHCDFDMIFGDLYSFFEEYKLCDYDKFLSLGHLTLYKNVKEVNERFMLECSSNIDYKKVFLSDQSFAFDEEPGINLIYKRNNFSFFKKRIFADISSIYTRYRLALNDKNYKRQLFYWDNGHIYRAFYDGKINVEEFAYIHFKKRKNYKVNNEIIHSNSFLITNNGFFDLNIEINLDIINEYNKYNGFLYEIFERCLYEFKQIKSKFVNKFKSIRKNHE